MDEGARKSALGAAIAAGALLSFALGCGASSSRPHVLVETDTRPGLGRDARVEIEYADPLEPTRTIQPGIEPIPTEKVCSTPCTVHVPRGPVAFSTGGTIFEATASPPGTRFIVHPRSGLLDAVGGASLGLGVAAVVLAAIAFPATDFGSSSSLDGTDAAVLTSLGGGLALSGLGLTTLFVWAPGWVETAPLEPR